MKPHSEAARTRTITSLQNERVKMIRSLHMRKARRDSGLFVAEGASPLFRIAVIHNDPATGDTATVLSNPLVGAMWAPPIVKAPYKVAFFGGLAIPLGEGGGNDANPTMTSTVRSALS